MIPILFSENATTFTTNGLGRLADAIKCVVREERNGAYELEMEYPITGVHYSDITESKIILAVPADGKYAQPFRVYKIERGIAGKIRVYAEHITYQANHIPVMPFEANSAASAMAQLQSNAIGSNPFTLWTDLQTTGHYIQEVPESIRARLGGKEGTILDLYGGEFEWDNYMIKLHQHRGQDRGVVLRYGKNLIDLTQENNITTTYTAVCPYVKESEDDPLITLPEKYIAASNAGNYPYLRIKTVDFTKEFDDEEEVTVAALRQKTNEYIAANNIGIPKISIKVSFVALWQTEEYKNIAPLERVNLCDTVTVRFEKLGVDAQAKVIKTEYNVLLDRYNSIEIGEAKSTISATVATQEQKIVNEVDSDLLRAQKHATELITGGLGGYVVLKRNANGKPEELLIMDEENIEEAIHVWRYNKNGWGYSSTGYNGLYTLAATLDGGFVADFITTGTLNANLVKTGMLTDRAGLNFWDMRTGDFQLSAGIKVGGKTVQQISDTTLNTFVTTTYNPDKVNLQDQIDGKAETWYQAVDPASSWTTAADKAKHEGDLWYKTSDQTTWFYTKDGNTYKWVQQDVPLEVFDEIDGKAQIFTSTPTTPYNVGDLWFQGTASDIMTCINDRATGAFQASDWQKRNKYVDQNAIDTTLNTFVTTTYNPDKVNLQDQIDGKAETWYQAVDPASSWTTAADKAKHEGDLWYKTSDQTTWFYTKDGNTYKWVQQDVPLEVFDEIDGKAQIFTSTPTTPYNVGDLWFQGTASDIMTCINDRATGAFQASDWQKRNKYVDQNAIDTTLNTYDTALNQQKVFNKLTNNGQLQGIYMRNGKLYINASYIASGAIADTSGNTLWDLTTGALSSKKFSIDSTYFKLTEGGKITSITEDGRKLEFEKGCITGFKTNGTQSAKLEIGDGYFNIVGKLALNGVVGVSGNTSFVKGLNYDEVSLGSLTPITIYTLASLNNSCTVSGGSAALSNGSVTFTGGSVAGNISVSGYVDGKYCTLSGYASGLSISGLSGYVNTACTHTNPSVTIAGQNTMNVYTGTSGHINNLKYLKAVSAASGTIKSADGLIQSIT